MDNARTDITIFGKIIKEMLKTTLQLFNEFLLLHHFCCKFFSLIAVEKLSQSLLL